MLTGDKGLTAKMIGIKCGLIPSSSINSDSELNSPSILIQIAPSFIHEEISKSIQQAKELSSKTKCFQVMVDGTTMA
jgi:magnesium-transporting ATPase (P-type)